MYEQPIKRAGLSMNRILYSNTKMVMGGFPQAKPAQFNLSFKYKAFENGVTTSTKCKSNSIDCAIPESHTCLSYWMQSSLLTISTTCSPPGTPPALLSDRDDANYPLQSPCQATSESASIDANQRSATSLQSGPVSTYSPLCRGGATSLVI